ncbi:MAG: OpgC family protein [Hyphomicrobiaceae bacterium]
MRQGRMTNTQSAEAPKKPAKRPRDVRLDVYRGLCLIIIFIAHIYANPWAQFIPARFGLSDATEIFVFCSGMASAIAFGSVFARHGYWIGISRVAFRIWQVYWAHVSLIILTAATMVVIDAQLGGDAYVRGLMLDNLFNEHAKAAVVGVITLTWVPPFFDILPMYLVILGFIPLVVWLAEKDVRYAAGAVMATWVAATFGLLWLPGEPWGPGRWFFNPFAWQLIFFTGFAFMRGWLPAPPADRRLIVVAVAVLILAWPLEWEPLLSRVDSLQILRAELSVFIDKSNLGILRYIHFLALAYLAVIAAGENGSRLVAPGPFARVFDVLRRTGQQSLAVFMAGILLSFLGGTILNVFGRSMVTVTLVNAGGIALLVLTAHSVAWFKSQPWQGDPRRHTVPVRPHVSSQQHATDPSRSLIKPAE